MVQPLQGVTELSVSTERYESTTVTATLCHDGVRWSETNSTTNMLQGLTKELQSFYHLSTSVTGATLTL